MEPPRVGRQLDFGSVALKITRILRLRRSAASSVASATAAAAAAADRGRDDYDAIRKLKHSSELGGYSGVFRSQDEEQLRKDAFWREREAAEESLLANLFASVSAIKAAYAQLQVAQAPYDPDTIQAADGAIVAELSRVSELKQTYFKNQFDALANSTSQPVLASQLEELLNLNKTYKITTHKLETEFELKNREIRALQDELLESDKKTRALEAKLHPKSSVAALDALHLSGLNPTHFLTALRYAYKSIRSFVNLMAREMESAGWDLNAAADAILPDLLRRQPDHRRFAFESFVCLRMFSNFHHKSFGLSSLDECAAWDRRRFFDEFTSLKSIAMNQGLDRQPAARFCRGKYLSLVHPKMEASIYGDLQQRTSVSTEQRFLDSEFFTAFAEMAWRVWLLHCLFFAFEPETDRSIFQVRAGTRFSEVCMESVTTIETEASRRSGDVAAFTVVPGFRVGRTLIQCKVYLVPGEPMVDGHL